MVPTYHPSIYGCVSGKIASGNGAAFENLDRYKGRPVSVLKDIHPTVSYELRIVMDAGQFAGFQTFWNSISRGADPFQIELVGALRNAHSLVPFKANHTAAGVWDVSWSIETWL